MRIEDLQGEWVIRTKCITSPHNLNGLSSGLVMNEDCSFTYDPIKVLLVRNGVVIIQHNHLGRKPEIMPVRYLDENWTALDDEMINALQLENVKEDGDE
jgi:hypothetical protein